MSVHNEQIYVYANVNPLWFSLPVADISWDFIVKFLCQINTSVQINGNGMVLVFSCEFSVQKILIRLNDILRRFCFGDLF